MHATTPRQPYVLAALAAAALLAGCSSKESRIESGLGKADTFIRAADWDKASVEVRNVLQIEPKTARAHLLAAQVAEGQRDLRRAYGHYQKAVELQPAFPDAQVGVVRLLVITGAIDKAEATLEPVLAADPSHVGARTMKAAIAARRGRTDEALAEAMRLVESTKPVPPDAALLLAGLQSNAGQGAQALATIDRALADDPKSITLLQVAGQVAAGSGKDAVPAEKAVGYFQRAVAQGSKNADLWKAWAAMHLQRGEKDLAEKVLRDAVAAEKSDEARRRVLVEFLLAQRGVPAAEKAYREAIEDLPREHGLRLGLADLYRSEGRLADAQHQWREVSESAKDAAPGLSARVALAAVDLAAGRLAEARTSVADVLKVNPRDNAALMLRARMHLIDDKPRDAIADLRGVVRDQPGSLPALSLLVQAHRVAGEPLLAREAVADAVKLRPQDPDLRLRLAAELADAGQTREALAELDAALKAAPRFTPAYELKARIAASQKDLPAAERALTEQKAALPELAIGALQLGKFYADTGRPALALREYDEAIEKFPREPAPYVAKVALLTAQKKWAEVGALLEQRAAAEPKNPLHEQLRGDVARARGDLTTADRAYEATIALAPTLPAGYVSLSGVRAAQGGIDAALAVLDRGDKALPASAPLQLARAEFLGRAGRQDDAIRVYEKVVELQPDNDTASNNLAFLLAHVKRDPASLDRALALAARFAGSANAAHLDSLGYVYFRRGEYARAVPVLERARALGPESPLIALNLGKALVKNGDAERGRPLIRRAIDSKAALPDLDEAKALLAG